MEGERDSRGGGFAEMVEEDIEGKAEAEGLYLPVVAMGLIPHIYRRACFTHRATPK